jgi:hypothetical protein
VQGRAGKALPYSIGETKNALSLQDTWLVGREQLDAAGCYGQGQWLSSAQRLAPVLTTPAAIGMAPAATSEEQRPNVAPHESSDEADEQRLDAHVRVPPSSRRPTRTGCQSRVHVGRDFVDLAA